MGFLVSSFVRKGSGLKLLTPKKMRLHVKFLPLFAKEAD
ncbi:hypothetical protein LEP1GSC008_3501 [Leptospira kirschneri serovar Bulgarica str. Nikolaevo]|uniref:Uncharacterized protein n=1 Tax=Leptospira kirschneri serovar Bulgarica str. Nikolaevo TaxID=1240687 RepID=M6FIM3_9LEPT|nr:hypothetical protein LEP1GSC008_3501 [Leptospira kirschneri serovar Bulgarica str. Nikolaevo]